MREVLLLKIHNLGEVQLKQEPPETTGVLAPSDRPVVEVVQVSHSGGEVAQLPDGDVGVHLLEVVPDHHGAVVLLVQTVHHNSAGGEENTKRFFCRWWTTDTN